MSNRTPRQILGYDLHTQLIFEGYEVVTQNSIAEARSQAYEEAASIIDENMLCSTRDGEEVLLPRGNSGNTVGTAYSKANQ